MLWAAAALVLLSRLPFLSAGYGVDPDAWRVVHAARHIAHTGSYEASRLPGYPVPELAYSVVAHGGPVAFNAITAVFSVAAFALLAAIARRHGVRRWLLVALAFAFTPVVYVQSTTSMDYLWALAFVLGAYLAALQGRPIVAGALLGLAAGCRITSGAMLVPIAVMLWPGGGWRAIVRAGFATAAVGLVAFAPVVWKYGSGFFAFYEDLGYPALEQVWSRGTVEVWGTTGVVAVAVGALLAVARGRLDATRRQLAAWISAIVLMALAFLRLPHEAAYLIPAVPFALLLASTALPDRALVAACAAIIVAPFASVGASGAGPGEVLQDRTARIRSLQDAEAIIARAAEIRGPSVVIVGADLPKFQVLAGDRAGRARFVYKAAGRDLRRARAAGVSVYVLRGQRTHNRQLTGADVASVGAWLLTPTGPRWPVVDLE